MNKIKELSGIIIQIPKRMYMGFSNAKLFEICIGFIYVYALSTVMLYDIRNIITAILGALVYISMAGHFRLRRIEEIEELNLERYENDERDTKRY